MNKITVFNYEENEVRTVEKDGEIWWVLADVCKVLQIVNYRDTAGRLADDEKGVGFSDTLGGKQEVLIINESGLYNVIFRSNNACVKRIHIWMEDYFFHFSTALELMFRIYVLIIL